MLNTENYSVTVNDQEAKQALNRAYWALVEGLGTEDASLVSYASYEISRICMDNADNDDTHYMFEVAAYRYINDLFSERELFILGECLRNMVTDILSN